MKKLIFVLFPFCLNANHDLGQGRPGDYLHVHHAPDPVNVRTGNFYLPMQDYFQPCFAYPIEWVRSYNSFSFEDGAFGPGWTQNHNVKVVFDQSQGVQIIESDGFVTQYDTEVLSQDEKNKIIENILSEKTKRDKVKLDDDFKINLKTDLAFFKKMRKKYLGYEPLKGANTKYVSSIRGQSTLEETKTGFLRTYPNGKNEVFDRNGRLIKLHDQHGNHMSLIYKNDQLSQINDSCDQSLFFVYEKNRIKSVRDNYSRQIDYTYDQKGRLISVKTLSKEKINFEYDNKNFLNKIDLGNGQIISLNYDPKSSKILSQIGPKSKVTDYNYQTGLGYTKTQVKDNEGENLTYEYIDAQNQIVVTDRNKNKTITTLSSCCSKPISVVDEKGVGDRFEYDSQSRLIKKTLANGQTITITYDELSSLPNKVHNHDGTYTTYNYDSLFNLKFAKQSSGPFASLTYESHGKIQTITNHQDQKIMFQYDRFGQPVSLSRFEKNKLLSKMTIERDLLGNIVKKTYTPNDPKTEIEIQTSLEGMLSLFEPAGIDFGL